MQGNLITLTVIIHSCCLEDDFGKMVFDALASNFDELQLKKFLWSLSTNSIQGLIVMFETSEG